MNDTLRIDRAAGALARADGRVYDTRAREWVARPRSATVPAVGPAAAEPVSAVVALRWLAREARVPMRVPVGVIGPREATPDQLAAAEAVGAGLADLGLPVICGGRGGVMQAVCEGVQRAGGLSIGLLPEADPELANPHARLVIATGIGEARNALIARAALCLVAIGDSFGTLSEVALGRQFGKHVIGLAGAARVDGVAHVGSVEAARDAVARVALGLGSD